VYNCIKDGILLTIVMNHIVLYGRMVDERLVGKGLEGGICVLIMVLHNIYMERLRKVKKTSVRIATALDNIQNEQLPNTSVHYSNPIGLLTL
jgi:hypothetical protein